MPSSDLEQTEIHGFGPWEFHPAESELRRGESRKSLTPTLGRLLLLLVTNHGELVTHRQIAEVLWHTPESVDTASGIHVAISRLRTILSEDNERVSYIHTVIGLGYRFVPLAAVEASVPVAVPTEILLPDIQPTPVKKLSWRKTAIYTGSLFIAIGAAWWGIAQWQNTTRQGTAITSLAADGLPVTFNDIDDKVVAEAISPTGKLLAYADKRGVSVETVASGERKILAPLQGFRIERIAWFGDEASLLVSAVALQSEPGKAPGTNSQVWQLSVGGTSPKLILDNAAMAVPSRDGRTLAFFRDGRTALWTSGPAGDAPRKLAQTESGDTYSFLLWSPSGDRLMTDRVPAELLSLADANLVPTNSHGERQHGAQRPSVYESYDANSGALLAHRDDVRFSSAAMLADGTLIYLANQSYGATPSAVVQTDLRTGAFRAEPVLLSVEQAFSVQAARAEGISATADGKTLAMILERENVDVYTADLEAPGSNPPLAHITRLTRHTNGNYPTSWAADNKTVVFDSGIGGPISIMSQALDSDLPHTLVQAKSRADRFAQAGFSPDGKWLLYLHLASSGDEIRAIERIPSTGGQSVTVPTTGEVEGFRCSISPAGRCVLREIEGNNRFVYYELDPAKGIGRELARTSLLTYVRGDWAVSPDGSTVAAANHDPAHPSIQLVQLAAAGNPNNSGAPVRELPIPGYGAVLSPSWAADGKSLFVQTTAYGQRHLLEADLQGHLTLLGQGPHLLWAVPSPDGRKIAFPGDTIGNRNVWLVSTRFKTSK